MKNSKQRMSWKKEMEEQSMRGFTKIQWIGTKKKDIEIVLTVQ